MTTRIARTARATKRAHETGCDRPLSTWVASELDFGAETELSARQYSDCSSLRAGEIYQGVIAELNRPPTRTADQQCEGSGTGLAVGHRACSNGSA